MMNIAVEVNVVYNSYNDAGVASLIRGDENPESKKVRVHFIDEYDTDKIRQVIGDFSEEDDDWDIYARDSMIAAGWNYVTEFGGRYDGESNYEKAILGAGDVETINRSSKDQLITAAQKTFIMVHIKDPDNTLSFQCEAFGSHSSLGLYGHNANYSVSGSLDQFHDTVIRLGNNSALNDCITNIESAISSLYPVTWERLNALLYPGE